MDSKNQSVIKYIFVNAEEDSVNEANVLEKFEKHKTTITHSNFEELHSAVFSACPKGFKCVEPIALFHEVLWSLGIKINSRGESKRCLIERDELHHAIEESEYGLLKWKSTPVISLCVDIIVADDSTTYFF